MFNFYIFSYFPQSKMNSNDWTNNFSSVIALPDDSRSSWSIIMEYELIIGMLCMHPTYNKIWTTRAQLKWVSYLLGRIHYVACTSTILFFALLCYLLIVYYLMHYTSMKNILYSFSSKCGTVSISEVFPEPFQAGDYLLKSSFDFVNNAPTNIVLFRPTFIQFIQSELTLIVVLLRFGFYPRLTKVCDSGIIFLILHLKVFLSILVPINSVSCCNQLSI